MRGLNVFVNIGAKMLPSLNATATAVERRFGVMNRRMRVMSAEARATGRQMSAAFSPLAGLAAAGGLMFSAKMAIGDSSELAHQLQMMRNAGRTSTEVAAAMGAANRTITALPTTTLIDNINVLNETTGAFGSFQHAMENLTFNQRVGSMMQNMLGEKAGSPGEMFNNIVRSMEMRGSAQNAHRYQQEVGELYKAMIFSGGKVNPAEIFGYSQQANPYTKGMSLRYLSRVAPSMIQEYGGDRAGTMQSTWTGTILGKAKNKISTEAWMKLGLLDPKQVVYNKVGPVGWKPGAIKGTDLALRDPLAWSEKVLIPAMRAHGFNTNDQLSLAKALMPLFRDRNANRMANTLVYDQDRQRLHKDEGLINKAVPVKSAYKDTLHRDPKMAWGAMKSSLTNLASVIFGTGKGESPVAVAMVNIAKGINWLAQALERHPRIAQGLGAILLGSAGLAALRVVGIGLRFILSPLRILGVAWRLLFSAIGRAGPRMPWITRIASGLRSLGGLFLRFGRFVGPMLLRGLTGLGPIAMRGLVAVGPWLLRGLAAAFGLLSNPVGWAILAASVGLLIWRYRAELAKAWTGVTGWFTTTAWPAVSRTISSINWRGVGMAIADALTFGLASKLPALLSAVRSVLPTWAGGVAAPRPVAPAAPAPAPKVGNRRAMWSAAISGKRARGGPVQRGLSYLVGEDGPELFRARETGSIVTADRTAAMMRNAGEGRPSRSAPSVARDRRDAGAPGRAPVHVGKIVVEGARDPLETARAVRREIEKLARRSSYQLSD